MKRMLTLLLALALPLSIFGQNKQNPNRATNRYGQPIAKVDGKWQPVGADLLARFNDRLDTIPGYDVPYKYTPVKITPEEWQNSTTEVITYKTYPGYELKLGIDRPKVKPGKPTPVIFLIHGGGWTNGSFDARNFVNQGAFFAGKGITVVRIGYTLSANGTIENTVADLQDAVKYVLERADELNIDPSRIAFSGISAGGHLSSYMAMTWPGTKALVDLCGPENLYRMFYRPERIKNESGGGLMKYFLVNDASPDGLIKYSPVNNIPQADKIPAVLIMHGSFDLVVPLDHSTEFAKALRDKGAKTVELRIIPYGKHTFFGFDTATFEDDLLNMLDFLQKHL